MYGPAWPMDHRSPRYERRGDAWHPKMLRVVPGDRPSSGRRRGPKEYRGAVGRTWAVEGNLSGRGPVRCVLAPAPRRRAAAGDDDGLERAAAALAASPARASSGDDAALAQAAAALADATTAGCPSKDDDADLAAAAAELMRGVGGGEEGAPGAASQDSRDPLAAAAAELAEGDGWTM